MNGYKQTKIAFGDTLFSTPNFPDGIYENGLYTYGFWTMKIPTIRYIASDHTIEINIEAKKSTTDKYFSVRSYEGGAVYTRPFLYIDSISISTIAKGSSVSSLTNSINFAYADILDARTSGKLEIDRYTGTPSGAKYFDWEDDDTWKKEKITIHLDKCAIENTGSHRKDVLSYIDHSSKNQDIEVSIGLGVEPGGILNQLIADVPTQILFKKVIDSYNAEKEKYNYTPRSVDSYRNFIVGEGLENQYIVFSEPQKVKKLQRGNFNVVLGTDPVLDLAPDGLLPSHTQMAYNNGAWDLEVSVDGGVTYSAFESEAAYTFGADETDNFSDTNSILFHDKVLISDFDDTTIANSNNCYLGDTIFRYAPPELAWNNTTRSDYYYKIMDNFEDKTD
mgnify:CR=1 FL=1